MKPRNAFTISNCKCPKCLRDFPIPRQLSRMREKGHRKKLWCPYCSEIVNMKEHR